jgi:hypothetical protein
MYLSTSGNATRGALAVAVISITFVILCLLVLWTTRVPLFLRLLLWLWLLLWLLLFQIRPRHAKIMVAFSERAEQVKIPTRRRTLHRLRRRIFQFDETVHGVYVLLSARFTRGIPREEPLRRRLTIRRLGMVNHHIRWRRQQRRRIEERRQASQRRTKNLKRRARRRPNPPSRLARMCSDAGASF